MSPKTVVTGIKPTGAPHLGNYFGAIRPALQLAERFDAFYFIADYHALNTLQDPQKLRQMSYEAAATFLALGMDPEKVTFYRQSDIPEIFELFCILANVTSKGEMNRAHAYKAMVAKNTLLGRDPDDGVNMGLFNYPILMAADILLFSADLVPIGQDQVQHVEIARELARSFNQVYGEVLQVPEVYFSEAPVLPGLDGRKMSKSYDNTIPLFTVNAKQLQKLIGRYKTDSTTVEAPKDPETSELFQLYRLVAPEEKTDAVRKHLLAGGMGWGTLKALVFESLDQLLREPRERYQALISSPEKLESIFVSGAQKAREKAGLLMRKVRAAVRG